MPDQKTIRNTIDISKAVTTVNTCLVELIAMHDEMKTHDVLTSQNTPQENNAYARMLNTRAGILNIVINSNLKLIAKVLPDAVAEPVKPGDGDLDAESAKSILIERISTLMPNTAPAEATARRLN